MRYNPKIHHRRSIRLKEYDYSQCGYYYITICTQNHENYFGGIVNGKMELNDIGKIAKQFWHAIPQHFNNVSLDKMVIMPNHFHGIIMIDHENEISNVGAIHELPLQETLKSRRKMTIPKIVGKFKMQTAKKINRIKNTPGVPFWQRNYYEHIIRNECELNRIREYIINNPIQWQLNNNQMH